MLISYAYTIAYTQTNVNYNCVCELSISNIFYRKEDGYVIRKASEDCAH